MASAPAPTAARAPSAAQKALQKLGLRTDLDFALHLPLRYEDETSITPIELAESGDEVQIAGVVTHSEVVFRGRRQLLLVIEDATASCQLRFFNFYPTQQKAWGLGAKLRVRGTMQGGRFERYMLHPSCKGMTESSGLPQALTPVYPSSAHLPQIYLRKAVSSSLQRCKSQGLLRETLPAQAQQHMPQPLWPLAQALEFLHYPSPQTQLATLEDKSHPAWQRLIAEELLAQQLAQFQAKQERARASALGLAECQGPILQGLQQVLPFALTAAQERVVAEISADMAQTVPMHRLLQGDVGSGKTVVAALAAAQAIDSGAQCVLLAPTEILAEQHFRKLALWLAPVLQAQGQQIAWLTGSQKKKERTQNEAAIADGSAALIVGTHALLQDKVQFAKLGLVVIDEQHRFGVEQRLALRSKLPGELQAHLLMMSATPIPRTLAMSYFADLDVSTIDELPPGRTPIVTKTLPLARYEELVERLGKKISEGTQAYWVCPLIEESETLDLSNATERFEALQTALPDLRMALLHARLPTADKQAVMAEFVAGKVQVLVSTTVIEVGVDVPNASLMVIEHAERFGLSQLHQLRGRVGRGAAASACVLLYGVPEGGRLSETARARLGAMQDSNDGFEIARRDLEIRGPGELLGTKQTGDMGFRVAKLERDDHLLNQAHYVAAQILKDYPQNAEALLKRWLPEAPRYAYV